MSVAHDLQTVISRVGLAVAGGDTYTRVDLERLARELGNIRDEATREADTAFTVRSALAGLTDDILMGVRDLGRLAERAAERAGIGTPAAEGSGATTRPTVLAERRA